MANRGNTGDGSAKNMVTAIVLAVMVIWAFDFFFPAPEPEKIIKANPTTAEVTTPVSEGGSASVSAAPANLTPSAPQAPAAPVSIAEALKGDTRITVNTPSLSGSLRLKGARFDDIILKDYRETMAKDSPEIVLLAPSGTLNPRYAEFSWLSGDKSLSLPTSATVWQTSSAELTPDKPLVLSWANGQGLNFTRTISVDDKYMFTVTDKIENQGKADITLNNYGLISRTGMPKEDLAASYVSFEGPIAVMNDTLEEVSFKDMAEKKDAGFTTSDGGWIGITDKYWLSALVFDQKLKDVKANFIYRDIADRKVFQTDYMLPATTIPAGQSAEVTNHFFVGAKEINTLDAYSEKYGIERFDLAIDFGWYYFLTKPFLYILDFLYSFLGNMGLAILVFAFLLRLAVFPIANKSYVSMHKMKLLQPKVKELTEQYKNDRPRLSQEMMQLYRKEKVNPASGCLPALIQIPIFFSLYKVLYIAIELRQAPFYGWIHDLSMPDPTSIFTLFGLLDWSIPEFLNIGVWPLIMGISMYIQFKLNPTPTDKTQAMIFAWMPIIFTFMLAHFAAGLVIYWAWSNILSIIQQRIIIYRMDKRLEANHKLKLKDIT